MCVYVLEFILFVWKCQDLKYKILIKDKKLKPQIKTEDAAEAEESADEGEDDEDNNGDDEEAEEVDEEENEDRQTKIRFWSPRQAGPKEKVSQGLLIRLTQIYCSKDMIKINYICFSLNWNTISVVSSERKRRRRRWWLRLYPTW